MNERLYDPLLHRFLQPDNYVQDPTNTQNFNRYGYCYNNPLKYTDASGEWIWIVVAAVVGGVINWVAHGAQFNMEGLKAFGIGAGAGALGALTGGAAFAAAGGAAGGAGGFLAGAYGGMIGSAVSQTFLTLGNHVAFGDPIMSGKEFITGIAIGGLVGGSVNGVAALRNGKTFFKGTVPRVAVQPISLQPVGLQNTTAQQPQASNKLPSTTQTSTAPTTQANTANDITFTKSLDGKNVKVNGWDAVVDDAGGTNSVYQGVDRVTGEVKYIGITERVPEIRFGEHYNSFGTGKELLRYDVIEGMENLSRINARILEQSLINQAGKGNLLNIRNSIAPKYWGQYGIKP